ncbi:C-C motif chemokine 25 [Galemys pyrenaicus]|uniref:C-C motif chemokine 25 n=1 Tax=Galemys pyrenaicus TaxID=202257 RepID=A0A8J6DSJ9_GALPY|nr:C-C motif chemokine 25 [Galemys pyrenaicus]
MVTVFGCSLGVGPGAAVVTNITVSDGTVACMLTPSAPYPHCAAKVPSMASRPAAGRGSLDAAARSACELGQPRVTAEADGLLRSLASGLLQRPDHRGHVPFSCSPDNTLHESSDSASKAGSSRVPRGAHVGAAARTMNLWLFACLVACFVGAWAPTVHAQGGGAGVAAHGPERACSGLRCARRRPRVAGVFEDCCLAYQRHVNPALRKRVLAYHRQVVSGSCNLRAVIFIFPNRRRTLCADPGAKWVQDWIRFLDKRKEAHSKPCPGNGKNSAGGWLPATLTQPGCLQQMLGEIQEGGPEPQAPTAPHIGCQPLQFSLQDGERQDEVA